MIENINKFDIAQHLKTEKDIQNFLNESALHGDASDFVHALGIAARAKGMTEIARQTGLTRASLYKSLIIDGRPRFDTIYKVCQALGYKLVPQAS